MRQRHRLPVLAVALGLWFGYRLARFFSRNVIHIAEVATQAAGGNFQARAKVESHDEFGQMAKAFNAMLDRLTTLLQTEEERDSMQKRLMAFLVMVSEVGKGDLTKRGEVTADMFGNLADGLNLMLARFGKLLGQVRDAAERVNRSAGSLREDMPPGSVMRISDHINFSGANPLIGIEDDDRFVGMTQAYDAGLAAQMEAAAQKTGTPLHQGVYMWFSGPSFETPAEIRMARVLGADAVGMSTVPEVLIARHLGLKVAAASVITNYGAGMTGSELSHHETKDMAPVGGARLAAILAEMIAAGETADE